MIKKVRSPAVAGAFYPADPIVLASQVESMLQGAEFDPSIHPRALIVPHAGYQYSGSTAAFAYQQLAKLKDIKRVAILGPAHRVYIEGVALPSCEYFATPLGEIPLDSETIGELTSLPQVSINDLAHRDEHAIEVQLPFIQKTLGEVPIVPMLFGQTNANEIAEALSVIWNKPGSFILISSDLSHFLDYEAANLIDQQTTRFIETGRYQKIDSHRACGSIAIQGLLKLAGEAHLSVKTLAQCNSGDTAGDKSKVVGYASYAIG